MKNCILVPIDLAHEANFDLIFSATTTLARRHNAALHLLSVVPTEISVWPYVPQNFVGGDASALAGIAPTPAIAWLDDYLLVVRDLAQASAIQHLFDWLGLKTHPDICRMACVWFASRTTSRKSSSHATAIICAIPAIAPRAAHPRRMCARGHNIVRVNHVGAAITAHTLPPVSNQCSGHNFKNTVAANNEPCCTRSLFCSYLHLWS